MEKTELLQKKLGSIQRGIVWAGSFGKVSYIVSIIWVIFALARGFSKYPGVAGWEVYAFSAIKFCAFGYFLFIIRDAFRAIEELISEIGEIV
jgi:hypothetical protein